MRSFLITGGAGFIGSCFVHQAVATGDRVVVLDAMTYAGHRASLSDVRSSITLVEGNISDSKLVGHLLREHKIDTLINFAAESHVDRSIAGPAEFIQTNIVGVYELLTASREYWSELESTARSSFRFVQVSTDEVFGSLGDEGSFTEESQYRPNSPYSASKAAADHLVRAWFHTYKLPTLTTNCSNNYGPRQFPEKLIPFMIRSALEGRPMGVYGSGQNVRDWIHVEDHCRGIRLAIEKGRPGESYCFGGRSERKNLDVVTSIARELDAQRPRSDGRSYAEQIAFVEDRKGHDWRYAIDDKKAERELGFVRQYSDFEQGLKETVRWYLENESWSKEVMGERR